MPHTLLMRLCGNIMSCGGHSRFDDRDTGLEPTKSQVLAMAASAEGRQRSASLTDLQALRMGVRIDAPGTVMVDFQTAGGSAPDYYCIRHNGSAAHEIQKNPSISRKQYLCDADFLVGLEGDLSLLRRLHAALENPKWVLFLGRKNCLPSVPVYLEDGLRENTALLDALLSCPLSVLYRSREPEEREFVIEADFNSRFPIVQDVPLCFESEHRAFAYRRVQRIKRAIAPNLVEVR